MMFFLEQQHLLQTSDLETRQRREIEREKELLTLQLKKKQAALKSDLERAAAKVTQAESNASSMKERCQRALARAKDKYSNVKAKLDAESNKRAVAEEAVERLKVEYQKLQQSTDLRVKQLMMQIRHIERDNDEDFSNLGLASLEDRVKSPHKDLFQQLKQSSNELKALSVV